MLTKEEEQQRALKISGLYFEARKEPRKVKVHPQRIFSWTRIVKLSIMFVLPFVMANIAYSIFTDLGYDNSSDVKANGMIFIASLIILGIWMFFALRRFINSLGDMVTSANSTFWLACFLLIPSILFLRSLTIGNAVKDGSLLIGGSLLFAVLALGLSVSVIAFLVYISITREN